MFDEIMNTSCQVLLVNSCHKCLKVSHLKSTLKMMHGMKIMLSRLTTLENSRKNIRKISPIFTLPQTNNVPIYTHFSRFCLFYNKLFFGIVSNKIILCFFLCFPLFTHNNTLDVYIYTFD
jgi:hypothetical protein